MLSPPNVVSSWLSARVVPAWLHRARHTYTGEVLSLLPTRVAKAQKAAFSLLTTMKPRNPLGGPFLYAAVQLFLNSSTCSLDPKFRKLVKESLVLVLQHDTIVSLFQALYPSSTER